METIFTLLALGLAQRDLIQRRQVERDRHARIVARFLLWRGYLLDLDEDLARGVVSPNMNSAQSENVPSFYLFTSFDVLRRDSNLWVLHEAREVMSREGLSEIMDWQAENLPHLRAELALWLPEYGSRLTRAVRNGVGDMQPAPREPREIIWNNPHGNKQVPHLSPEEFPDQRLVALIDCESLADVKAVQQKFGEAI
ncbi:hypothetical protein ACEUZ9_005472 [Paracoccus litorisediminis]|uniref:hypothetical protein n=1 Tax=Paracoccus litorisediminis TaxID=2006130 RepID=UPI00372FF20C